MGNPRKTTEGGRSRDHCQMNAGETMCAQGREIAIGGSRETVTQERRKDAEAGSSRASSLRARRCSEKDLLDAEGRV